MCRLSYATCHDAGYANIGRPAASSCAFSGAIARPRQSPDLYHAGARRPISRDALPDPLNCA